MGEFILEFEMLFEPFWGFIFEGGYTILKGVIHESIQHYQNRWQRSLEV